MTWRLKHDQALIGQAWRSDGDGGDGDRQAQQTPDESQSTPKPRSPIAINNVSARIHCQRLSSPFLTPGSGLDRIWDDSEKKPLHDVLSNKLNKKDKEHSL